jgi:hypothetical protein
VSQQCLSGWVTAPEQPEDLGRGLAATQRQHSVPVGVWGGTQQEQQKGLEVSDKECVWGGGGGR